MPKEIYDNGVISLSVDTSNPNDVLLDNKRIYKGKSKIKLTPADKIKLFDAYYDARIIKL